MHPLDNVIWSALTSSQAHFALGNGLARRFPEQVTSLAALLEPSPQAYNALGSLLASGGVGALFLEAAPAPLAGLEIVRQVPLLQMAHSHHPQRAAIPSSRERTELGPADSPEMLALTALTQPGPFGPRTHELGTYLGIRKSGRLAAMAGERLRLPGYTEISAVCTHPEHLGHGYAGALIAELVARIRGRGETPFLHVRPDNERAVSLYQRLGFERRRMFELVVVKAASA